jgi:hypothetical protein
MMLSEATVTLLWVNADEAVAWRWRDGDGRLLVRMESEVPTRHRSMGHIRRASGERHGGSGPRSAQEGHRLEHLHAFLTQVQAVLPTDDELLLLGDGTVVEQLAARVRADDAHHRRTRTVQVQKAERMTDRQLVARLREFAGDPPRRMLARR